MDDVRRMQDMRAELARLEAAQAAMSPEESAMLFEDSDMAESMAYAQEQAQRQKIQAQQEADLRRRAAEGDAMANTLLSGEDPPSPPMRDPFANLAPMRMDGMGAGPKTTE
tara:strand:+ start:404 stop:736 length:333 start_codon:yes stop_codon:yes gene_type:complete